METTIRSDLGPLLSTKARIHLQGDDGFAGSVSRWREYQAPQVSAVVQVASEADVVATVKYAVANDIPFIARSGGHGANSHLANARNAIQIDMRLLDTVELSKDGKSAKIGGGATVLGVVDALEKVNKRTVTGNCEGVGISALVMGGGHGWLQGRHGLVADQVTSARVVLPNGELATASETVNPDLFWALKGAGHNFGTATEWEFRTFDMEKPTMSYEIFTYSGDKLEDLYTWANTALDDQPAGMTHWSYIIKPPGVDLEHPILWIIIAYDGPTEVARAHARPLLDLGPLSVQAGEATIHELAVLTFQDLDGPGSAYGITNLRFPINLDSYNVAALRKVYDEIDKTYRDVPELAGSFFLLEGYSNHGVLAVDDASTAFAQRGDRVLITSYLQYKPDPEMDSVATEFGKKLRQHLLDGSDDPKRHTAYINYAHGDEALEALYGWDEWRLEKLRKLKAQWDPENRMRYFAPIV